MTLFGVPRQLRAMTEGRPRWPQRFRARGRDVVVLYHRVAEVASDPGGMAVQPARFRRQLLALREHFEVVPASEVVTERTTSEQSSRPRAAITFDDGYADNLDVAVPVLRELGLPAAFFLVSGALEDPQEYWWDRLDHLLLEDLPAEVLQLRVSGSDLTLDLRDTSGRRGAVESLNRLLIHRRPQEVEDVLDQLARCLGRDLVPCRDHRRLSPEELVELADDDQFELGSHTCTHGALGRMTAHASLQELTLSRRRLHEVLGVEPRMLAYPYGAAGAVRRRDARLAARAGYKLAFANVTGPVEGCSAFAVPRISVGEWEPAEFISMTTRWSR